MNRIKLVSELNQFSKRRRRLLDCLRAQKKEFRLDRIQLDVLTFALLKSDLLAVEYYAGEEFIHAIARATNHGDNAHLYRRLNALALSSPRNIDRTANGQGPSMPTAGNKLTATGHVRNRSRPFAPARPAA
jgi:hypothetical protein